MEDVMEEACPRDRERCREDEDERKLTDEQIINKRLEEYENEMNEWREAKRLHECNKKAQEEFITKHPDFVKEFKKPNERHIFTRLAWLRNRDENGNELTEADEPVNQINAKKKWLTPEELENLRGKITACMERQKEILDVACDFERFKDMPNGHFNALVDEYAATEKLKLVLVDRLHANLRKDSLSLCGKDFSAMHCGWIFDDK